MPPDALVLGFDTSAAHCAAALLSGDRVLAARQEDMAKGQAERLMGLQMVVVGSMAIALFAMLRKRGENDAEGEDPMTVSEDDDDDGATAAERRVARASLAALGVGIFAAAIVYTTSYT